MAWMDDFNAAKNLNSFAHKAISKGKALISEKLSEGLAGSKVGSGRKKSIHDFIGMTSGSFARPSLYEVSIFPKGTSNNDLIQRMNLNCHTATIPGLAITTGEKNAGYRSYAQNRVFGDFSCSFHMHEDMLELKIFQDWMKLMVQPEDNHVGFYDSYKSTVEIRKLDRQQKSVLTTTLHDAYPKSISQIDLSYGNTSTILSLTVGWQYRYCDTEFDKGKQETSAKGGAQLIDLTPQQRISSTDGIIDKTLSPQQREDLFGGATGASEDGFEEQ